MILSILLGAALGGAAGFGWYKLVGCPDGTCPITRSPWTSTAYGIVVGALIASTL